MDALEGIGHACGHNLIGMSGIAVACAMKAAMEQFNISGTIQLLGTPGLFLKDLNVYRLTWNLGEEGGSGKVKLLEKGAYKDMDICLMCVTIVFSSCFLIKSV